jgi:hypothetical protein
MAQKQIKTTTVKISENTRDRLEHLKEHKEESFDTLINKSLNILNLCKRSPGLAARVLKDIDKTKKRKELLENPDSALKKKPVTDASITRNMEANVQRMKINVRS